MALNGRWNLSFGLRSDAVKLQLSVFDDHTVMV